MNKKIIISIFLCLSLGIFFSYFIYNSYKKETKLAVNDREVIVYLMQVGAFKNYNNANKMTKSLSNYLIVEEQGFYKIYVGLTKNKKNLIKLEEFFNKKGNNIYIVTKKITNKKFTTKLTKYDYLLEETNDYETIKMINKTVLNSYKEDVLSGLN